VVLRVGSYSYPFPISHAEPIGAKNRVSQPQGISLHNRHRDIKKVATTAPLRRLTRPGGY
jgi:hypothetical protein